MMFHFLETNYLTIPCLSKLVTNQKYGFVSKMIQQDTSKWPEMRTWIFHHILGYGMDRILSDLPKTCLKANQFVDESSPFFWNPSMDWLKQTSTGNHCFKTLLTFQVWGFPAFLLQANQSGRLWFALNLRHPGGWIWYPNDNVIILQHYHYSMNSY